MVIKEAEYAKIFGLLAITSFALSLIFLSPLDPLPWQWADDALYFKNAQSILSNIGMSHWLGPFNNVALSKAPFFSVFLAGIHCLGIPLRLAEFFLFVPLPFLLLKALSPLKLDKWLVLYVSTICIVCIPVAGVESRLLRTTLFGALSLYCLVSLTGVVLRCLGDGCRIWPWAMIAGLALGLAATTREEAAWLMVPTAMVILLAMVMAWHSKGLSHIFFVVILCIGYFLPVTIFSTLNYTSYGVYSPSLRQNKDFRDFFAILCSLQPEQQQKYVPINTKTRELVYAVSPHFAELRPYLEGPALDHMALNKGHLSINGWGDIPNAREFFVSNFEFALSEAIVLSGNTTGQSFLKFCRQTTAEIQMAIEHQRLEQGALGFSMMSPLKSSDINNIFAASLGSLWHLLKGEGQYRHQLIQTDPPSTTAMKWDFFLRTWPFPPTEDYSISIKITNRVFNTLVDLFRMSYWLILIISGLAGIRAYTQKCENYKGILVMLLIGWAALLAFSFAMGVADTLAFPTIIRYPSVYNKMGFFPVHFLLMISLLAFMSTLRGRSSEVLPNITR